MVIVQSIDVRGLQFLIGGLQNALIGAGADCQSLVKQEAKLLAIEIASRVGPRDRQKKVRSIPREIGRVFVPAPVESWGKEKTGHGEIMWLNSGPNFLTGIEAKNYNPTNDLVWMERTFNKLKTMGNKYSSLGHRGDYDSRKGGQHVQLLNRIMVKRSSFASFVTRIVSHLGRMKATWYATARKLDPALVAPQWIERHILNNPKTIAHLGRLSDPQSPSLEFGSSAVGIEQQIDNINRAVMIRRRKVLAHLNLVLSGYAKDVNSGRVPRRRAKQYAND